MKWITVFVAGALLGSFSACEKHPASQLSLLEPAHEGAEHGETHEARPAGHSGTQPHSGSAPKFFPEKKH